MIIPGLFYNALVLIKPIAMEIAKNSERAQNPIRHFYHRIKRNFFMTACQNQWQKILSLETDLICEYYQFIFKAAAW